MKTLIDIYEQTHFAFISYHPTNFEESVKEKERIEAINNEIETIEKNKTRE